jgi:hypothetical protein
VDGARGPLRVDRPAAYEIVVQGWVGSRWVDWLDGMSATLRGDDHLPSTVISGVLSDQAALLGVLQRLHNLGFTISTVAALGAATREQAKGRR